MYIEHLFYTGAIAVIAGMFFVKYTGRDPSILILATAYLPDIDIIPNIFCDLNITQILCHGEFHNLTFIIMASLVIGYILHKWCGFDFRDAIICVLIGSGAHLLEDMLVYRPAYAFFAPFSTMRIGFGLLPWARDMVIGNSTTLTIGILFLIAAICVRRYFDGKEWYKDFLKFGRL